MTVAIITKGILRGMFFLPKLVKKHLLVLLVLAAITGSTSAAFYFWRQYQHIKANPDTLEQKEVESLTAQVSRLMDLPQDEEPSIATVVDPEALKGQHAFFAPAQKGDKLLVYPKAQKAILFRPVENRVVNFTLVSYDAGTPPAVAGETTQEPQASPEPQQVKVAIYNGTKTGGLAQTAEQQIKAKYPRSEITIKRNAAKDNYQKSRVVDLSGGNSALAGVLAGELKGEVGILPEGEAKPEGTDLLIILGEEFAK